MISKELLIEAKNKYATPCFLFDETELTGRAKEIIEIFRKQDKSRSAKLCFSIKANPFLINSLIDVVDNLEVCSPGELQICMALKVPAEKIIYSGVHKDYEDVADAISYGAGLLTAESIRHYELICQAAKDLDRSVKVVLRLTSKNQFGMSLEDIKYILEKNKTDNLNDRIDIEGIHYFAGTGRKKLKQQIQDLEKLKDIFAQLRSEYGYSLKKLEYGPGLNYPYFEDEDFSDTLLPAKELAPYLEEASKWCDLTVEMGRFIASSCGYYLTGVADVKSSEGSNWCIIDGGINHVNYLGQIIGMKVPSVLLIRDDKVLTHEEVIEKYDTEKWSVCGSLCTANDVLIRDYITCRPGLSDVYVFENIGAYSVTEGINLFLSRTMPKILICKDNKIEMVRDNIEAWKINSVR